MTERDDERLPLSQRPDDWHTATDEEIITALGTRDARGFVDPRWINYVEQHRPAAMCRYLSLHELMGGYVGPPARRFLRRHGR
jgi:hypothetical protein